MHGLHPLGCPSEVRDEQARRGVPEGVESVFGFQHGGWPGSRFPVSTAIPLASCRGSQKRLSEVLVALDVAGPIGEYKAKIALGAFLAPLRSALTAIGARGMSRLPALLLGLPIVPHWSARCRTWTTALSRSTLTHGSPRNSLARIPVKIAVMTNGRHRPLALSRIVRSSSRSGKSTPARTGATSRWSSLLILTAAGDVLGHLALALAEREHGLEVGQHLAAHRQ